MPQTRTKGILPTARPGAATLATRYLYDAGGNRVARLWLEMTGSTLSTADTLELTLREGQGRELVRLYQASQPRPVFADGTITGTGLIGTMGAGPLDYPDTARRHADSVRYLLQDHLGNVRLAVSDRKRATLLDRSRARLAARVLSATDYYPYGMAVPERSLAAASRFGYNGKPLDPKLGGSTAAGSYDYGFRIYDPVLARFPSLDPLREKYAELTPYQFASNTPIQAIDLDGLEAKIANKIGVQKVQSNKTPGETRAKPIPSNSNTAARANSGNNAEKLADGVVTTSLGLTSTIGGAALIVASTAAAPAVLAAAAAAVIIGVGETGFGLAQMASSQSKKPINVPGGYGEALDIAAGGDGSLGSAVDLVKGGIPKTSMESAGLLYGLYKHPWMQQPNIQSAQNTKDNATIAQPDATSVSKPKELKTNEKIK